MRLLFSIIILFVFCDFANAKEEGVNLLYDSEVSSMINKVIAPICKAAGVTPSTVYIIISKEINAFVTQGDELFINTGLITAFNDPDVLRGVVAHELGHLAGNHPLVRHKKVEEMLNQSFLTTLLGLSAMAMGNPALGMGVLLGGMHTSQSIYLRYSREQETVADRLAVKYLHASNFTIEGFVKLAEYFNSQELYLDSTVNPYMLTHPLTKERLKTIREYLWKEKDNPAIHAANKAEKEEYSRIVSKLLAFLEPDEYFKRNKNDLSEFSQDYGNAIAYYRKAQFNKSFEILDKLVKLNTSNGYLYELKGQLLFDTGKALPAIDAYKKAISILGVQSSVSTDYAIVLVDASDFCKDRKATLNEAITILNKASGFTHQKNPYIYRKLAVAYGKLGDLGYSNLMLAEEALLLNRKQEADRFLSVARNYVGNDHKLKLKIDDLTSSLKE